MITHVLLLDRNGQVINARSFLSVRPSHSIQLSRTILRMVAQWMANSVISISIDMEQVFLVLFQIVGLII